MCRIRYMYMLDDSLNANYVANFVAQSTCCICLVLQLYKGALITAVQKYV